MNFFLKCGREVHVPKQRLAESWRSSIFIPNELFRYNHFAQKLYPDRLNGQNLVVSLEGAIKGDLDIQVHPNIVPILEVKLDSPSCHQNIQLNVDSILQITSDRVSDGDTDDGGFECDVESSKVDPSGQFDRPKGPVERDRSCWPARQGSRRFLSSGDVAFTIVVDVE